MTPDTLIESVRPAGADILVLPGSDRWLDPGQQPVLSKVADLLIGGTVVAAICGATLGLASAGLLDNRPHTSNDPGVLQMFCPNYRGAKFYRAEPAVTDNNLITASGLAPVEFACHIFRRLGVMHPATLDAWHGLFTTRKPEYFFALMASLPGQQKG
jgi:putative intracellular protease/amidase